MRAIKVVRVGSQLVNLKGLIQSVWDFWDFLVYEGSESYECINDRFADCISTIIEEEYGDVADWVDEMLKMTESTFHERVILTCSTT